MVVRVKGRAVICRGRPEREVGGKNYRENDTASAIPSPRAYTGCTLTLVRSPDASNLMCGFERPASIAHPINAPIPQEIAVAPA